MYFVSAKNEIEAANLIARKIAANDRPTTSLSHTTTKSKVYKGRMVNENVEVELVG